MRWPIVNSRHRVKSPAMQNVLIIVHLFVVLALVAVVLLQRSEGGGLGLGGGSSGVSGFLTGRGQANALTRATTILAAAFFLTSILLTMLQTYGKRPASILDTAQPGTSIPAQGQPAASGSDQTILDQLKRNQGGAAPQPGQPAPANGPQVPLPQ
jgi:preprotein translocase subunit SecG